MVFKLRQDLNLPQFYKIWIDFKYETINASIVTLK